MGKTTGITWTSATFNPWVGCVEKDEGCEGCYARELDKRYKYGGGTNWGKMAKRHRTSPSVWRVPLQLNAHAATEGVTRRIFCASMADVFEDHPSLPQWREDLWAVIRKTPNLHWQLLTKRPENVLAMLPMDLLVAPHVWLGFSASNQRRFMERIDYARQWREAGHLGVNFVSAEPLLGPITLGSVAHILDWVIVGGETGADRRRFDLEWAADAKAQCDVMGIAFYGKQAASLRPGEPLVLEGRTWHAFPTPGVVA